jgi:flavin-dependent dehydrogenase
MKTNVDAIIIGGGLAGLTSAINLTKFGFEVILIEKMICRKKRFRKEFRSDFLCQKRLIFYRFVKK